MSKLWVQNREKLNRKLVIRVSESLYQNLLEFLSNNPRYTTVSQLIRSLLYDQLSCQEDSGLGNKQRGDISGRTKAKTQGQWETTVQ